MRMKPLTFTPLQAAGVTAGTITQTRRVVSVNRLTGAPVAGALQPHTEHRPDHGLHAPGDLLWVREDHFILGKWLVGEVDGNERWRFQPLRAPIVYCGDVLLDPDGNHFGEGARVAPEPENGAGDQQFWRYRTANDMAIRRSRALLLVTAVRECKLQTITPSDYRFEGEWAKHDPESHWDALHRDGFHWADNPPVQVIRFEAIHVLSEVINE